MTWNLPPGVQDPGDDPDDIPPTCALCAGPAAGAWQGRPICGDCAAQVQLAHLRQTGRLRAWLSTDRAHILTSPNGVPILAVLTSWAWKQRAGRTGWATTWYVRAADPTDASALYWGRGAGGGRPVTLQRKLLPKRVREALEREGLCLKR